MSPYFLLTRDCNQLNRLAQDVNRLSKGNTHHPAPVPVNCDPVKVSDMISGGAYHAVNAIENGWKRVSKLF